MKSPPESRFVPDGWLPLPWTSAIALSWWGQLTGRGRDPGWLHRREHARRGPYPRRGLLVRSLGYVWPWVRAAFASERHAREIDAPCGGDGP